MRGRLITNCVLSIISSIAIVVLVLYIGSALNQMWYKNYYMDNPGNKYDYALEISIITFVIYMLSGTASLVMGIVTLSTKKHENARGLTIASGILAILNGCFLAGAIVSLIAALKAK